MLLSSTVCVWLGQVSSGTIDSIKPYCEPFNSLLIFHQVSLQNIYSGLIG